ncbi:cytochrome P450 [Hypoxylon trugodes]|uniref:cytochrome P450 n=1 Tax=Hypoxylon trugodes TaxID=326681 RepID=UPI00218F8F37|nr:cytochrome P450 [Hypoxylon trugodes]KAI1385115.1 cytochrome P450 [Hypoxylon trugodes]
MYWTLTAGFAVVLLTYSLLRALLYSTQDVHEPPPLDTFIPFISPVIRMAWMGTRYWTAQRDLPIYTIRLPATRLYVVNSTSLIPAVQRHVRTLSFSPILSRIASNLIAASQPGVQILSEDEEDGFIARFHNFNHVSLASGSNLDALNKKAWEVTASLHSQEYYDSPRKLRMYEWISHGVMMVTTEALYGHQNPFRSPEIREAWHEYKSGLTYLVTGFMSSITAKKSARARKALFQAFERYYEGVGLEDVGTSTYIKKQHDVLSHSGLSDPDIAKTATAFTIALLANTIQATFWLVYHIFSNDAILQDCRKELLAVLQKGENGSHYLDLTSVKHSCPILFSTYQETIRTHSMGVSVVQAVEDQLIAERYLLRKGALVMIPSSVQHGNKSIWGENVDDFDYLRFHREKGKKKGWNPVAFRGFGGGLNLCPGRHFATSTALGFAASIILSFDMQPTNGRWVRPTIKNSSFSIALNQPDTDLDVKVYCREEQEWKATFSTSERRMQVSAEDIDDGGMPVHTYLGT